MTEISIHALLAESDTKNSPALLSNDQFLSTLSLRRATEVAQVIGGRNTISIHALLAESDVVEICSWPSIMISIHALLAESDVKLFRQNYECFISIHALLAESDYITTITICTAWKFLSTLSLRRAT